LKKDITGFDYLRQKAWKSNTLLSIHFDITYRCPLRCIHCYIDHRKKRELTTREIEKILKDGARLNALFVTYSGGEVFARKDIEEIFDISRRLGYSIKIITSGYLIDHKEIEILKRYNILNVGVSLYSINPEVHDSITGVKGSFAKTSRAIQLMAKNNISVTVKTSIMKQNYRDYPKLLRWIESLGENVSAQYDMVITPTMENRCGVKDLNIDFASKRALYKKIQKIEGKREVKVEEMEGLPNKSRIEKSITCFAGITGLYIDPEGKVYPCVEWNILLGDLRKTSLIEIWKRSEKREWIRSLRIPDYGKCYTCKYVGVCSICPGLNLRDNGDIFEPSRLACERAMMYYGR